MLYCRESACGRYGQEKKIENEKEKMSCILLLIYTVDITNNRKKVRNNLAVFLDALQTKCKSTSRKKQMYNPLFYQICSAKE